MTKTIVESRILQDEHAHEAMWVPGAFDFWHPTTQRCPRLLLDIGDMVILNKNNPFIFKAN